MTSDYPDDFRIRERSRWLYRIWIVVDLSYYFGLVGGVIWIAMSIVAAIAGGLHYLFGLATEHSVFQLSLAPLWLLIGLMSWAVSFAAFWLKRLIWRRWGATKNEP